MLPACVTGMKRRPCPASGPGPTTVCRPSSALRRRLPRAAAPRALGRGWAAPAGRHDFGGRCSEDGAAASAAARREGSFTRAGSPFPPAGADRESTNHIITRPVGAASRGYWFGSGCRCLLAAGLGRSRAFDGEEPLVDLAEGDLDVAQASIHAADSSPTATTPPSSFSHRVVVCPCRHFRTVRGVGPSVPFISSFAPCGRSEPRSSCTANDTRHVRTRRSSTSPVVFRRRPGGPWTSASGTSGRRLRPVPP